MAILAGDLKMWLSGGASNATPNLSLGGARSTTTELLNATLNNLFDDVTSGEATAGDTEYRCVYLQNDHASLTLENAAIYITQNTPSPDTEIFVGADLAGVNGTADTVVDEDTAPSPVVSFSTAAGIGNKIVLGNIPFGQVHAIWVRRVTNVSSGAFSNDNFILRFQGDTLP